MPEAKLIIQKRLVTITGVTDSALKHRGLTWLRENGASFATLCRFCQDMGNLEPIVPGCPREITFECPDLPDIEETSKHMLTLRIKVYGGRVPVVVLQASDKAELLDKYLAWHLEVGISHKRGATIIKGIGDLCASPFELTYILKGADAEKATAWYERQPNYKVTGNVPAAQVEEPDSSDFSLPEDCKCYRVGTREVDKQGVARVLKPVVQDTISEAEAWIKHISALYSSKWERKVLSSVSPTTNECWVVIELTYKG